MSWIDYTELFVVRKQLFRQLNLAVTVNTSYKNQQSTALTPNIFHSIMFMLTLQRFHNYLSLSNTVILNTLYSLFTDNVHANSSNVNRKGKLSQELAMVWYTWAKHWHRFSYTKAFGYVGNGQQIGIGHEPYVGADGDFSIDKPCIPVGSLWL